MIGNDIVDLAKALKESDILRPRFLSKVCKPQEIDLVLSSHTPKRLFWRIWTMKESAYKAFQRKHQFTTVYNPFAFSCQLDDFSLGKVGFNGEFISTETLETEDFIYSEVKPSKETRRFFGSSSEFLEHIQHQFNLNQLPKFHKTKEGMPFLELYTGILIVSKTHHGKFQAFQY